MFQFCRKKINAKFKSPHKKLRILTYPWHCGQQYELFKLPHKFTLAVTPETNYWNYSIRPLRRNVHIMRLEKIKFKDYDLAIVPFDEKVLNPSRSRGLLPENWGSMFITFVRETNIPKIATCHGIPPFKGEFDPYYKDPDLMKVDLKEKDAIVNLIGGIPVICNSFQAQEEWGFKNSYVIWHGLDAREYPPSKRGYGIVYVASHLFRHPWYRGYWIFREVVKGLPHTLIGEDYNREFCSMQIRVSSWLKKISLNLYGQAMFRKYVKILRSHSIYLNTSLTSPMPRSRTEGMLVGLVPVTLNNHDTSLFIRSGENGFLASNAQELREHVEYLLNRPNITERIGIEARKTAMTEFDINCYLSSWQDIIEKNIS